tara:strand:- start:256 stop:933 length:678 start_codon:yes stop_codon:yes gene_type:complete
MLIDLFPTKIFRTKLAGIDDYFLQELLHVLEEDFAKAMEKPVHSDRGQGTFSTLNIDDQLHNSNVSLLQSIVADVNSIIVDCWKELNYNSKLKPGIRQMWALKTLPGGTSVYPHNHSPYPLAGVLYLKLEKGMGNIIFENPNNLVVGMDPYNWDEWNSNTNRSFVQDTVKVETGDLIIFPGWLRHFTEENQTTENRYVLSFNFDVLPVIVNNKLVNPVKHERKIQ